MDAKFAVGDKVDQSPRDKFVGTVKAVFTTKEGEARYAVDVSLHDVAREARGGSDGPFQIHPGTCDKIAQVAALERLWRKVGRKRMGCNFERGQADAVHRDTRAFGEIGEHGGATNAQSRASRARIDRDH